MRIVHLSDIHFWRYSYNPWRLASKRIAGMASLLAGRARRFRMAGVPRLVERVRGLGPDHILITGDLTTTALPDEFRAARQALADLLEDPSRATVLPGNHDRYTWWAHRSRRFEAYFGDYAPRARYPWLRTIGDDIAILGLDPTRAAVTARGKLPRRQLDEARALLDDARRASPRIIVACHYPLTAPDDRRRELGSKPMINAAEVRGWLSEVGPHVYCCGHVHAAWAFRPPEIPDQLCLNPGAPLLVPHHGRPLPGFLEIELQGPDVTVHHHAWTGEEWDVRLLRREERFFAVPGRF